MELMTQNEIKNLIHFVQKYAKAKQPILSFPKCAEDFPAERSR